MAQNPDPSSLWTVKLYQLNCVANTKGDAAILLLIRKEPKELVKCVLIDSGNGKGVAHLIDETMLEIETEFERTVQFDAVLFSHWDTVSPLIQAYRWC